MHESLDKQLVAIMQFDGIHATTTTNVWKKSVRSTRVKEARQNWLSSWDGAWPFSTCRLFIDANHRLNRGLQIIAAFRIPPRTAHNCMMEIQLEEGEW